ncbi:hypothetical protein PCASD_21190 [Puccinia coronata f. sp. avenae]|uniref:Uncharacterized protein n=1 Tax=Puccinia coronata f. sp. avenae TaxID=200324 RepID=A0A2N5RUW1_9BASI|nr:hypothetical protein PCASD_26497 [Puccinia coronata f. sp. avenae]PLW29850.1 hypothetical protein PCASD_21190 [Puccinia coronata f. sp. avenae]
MVYVFSANLDGQLIVEENLDGIFNTKNVYRITPPIEGAKLAALGELEGEKDDDSANDGADVEAGGEEKVVLGSPAELHPAEHILEDEADEDPRHVVDGRRRRDPAGPQ